MAKNRRSFPERAYKANIMPGGLSYKISPMSMIIDQMRRDSMEAGIVPDENTDDDAPDEGDFDE